ncbi:uncharacterized protein LOC143912121 [Arctopsyche grandis]|uniref:uncharacterized protein LOC143912121 n=1 Tax=Arctopsyche grandis TaxID=121162 RepID=UPI00406D64C6
MEDTDSELEASENEDEEVYTSNHGFQWNSLPPSSSRRRECNIVTENSGLINGSTTVNTIREMFSLFINSNMVREICEQTNRQLHRTSTKIIEPILAEELLAFI